MQHIHRRAQRTASAFTLIELLVVIVILGVLLAVAVPTFLRQQSKAQDSRTQQHLTTAFKAIRASTPDTGNAYPSSTSMVSWIQQSEPELTAQRGDCLTGVTSAPADAVLVDPSSTSTSLQLCSRSASGNVWKLTATNTGAQQLLDGTLVPLTFSGNEITDATRTAAVQGDGLSNDSSTGVWEGTTNLIENGGFESGIGGTSHGFWTSTNFWSGVATASQDTTTSKFGASSMKVVTTGESGEGWGLANTHLTVNGSLTFSVWAKGSGTAFLGATGGKGNGASFTLTSAWTRYAWTVPQSGDIYNLTFYVAASAATTFWIDGAQLEALPYATPYVQTNGATASRAAARVQAPASFINETQSWIALRIRYGFPSTATPTTLGPELFYWADDTSNRFRLFLNTDNTWNLWRNAADVGPSVTSAAQTFSAGDYVTLVGYWTATHIGLSVNGGAFRTDNGTGIPNLAATTFSIGGRGDGSRPIDGDILWCAIGTGTLTDADAATIDGFGNNDPNRSSFPPAAQATMVWNGVGGSGSLR